MATSFECDGCGHHASYHAMENPAEEAIAKRWKEEEKEQQKEQEAMDASTGPKKRPRKAIENEPSVQSLQPFGRARIVSTTKTRTTAAARSTKRQQNFSPTESEPHGRVFDLSDG